MPDPALCPGHALPLTFPPIDRLPSFVPAVTDDHATLATRRPASALPGPDFHRLDRTSLAWRTHIPAHASADSPRSERPVRVGPFMTHCGRTIQNAEMSSRDANRPSTRLAGARCPSTKIK